MGRQKEFAMRMALGASRGAILRQSVAENVWIAIPGGVAGAILAAWGMEAVRKLLPADSIARSSQISMDLSALAMVLGIAVATTFLFALAPVLTTSRLGLDAALKEGNKTVAGSPRTRRRIDILIGAEVALAFVLLVGAGLFVASYSRLERVPLGFDVQNILSVRIAPTGVQRSNSDSWRAFYRDFEQEVQNVPGKHPGMIYGVGVHDPASLACSAGLVLALAALAGLVPGARASRIDPLTALRH